MENKTILLVVGLLILSTVIVGCSSLSIKEMRDYCEKHGMKFNIADDKGFSCFKYEDDYRLEKALEHFHCDNQTQEVKPCADV